MTLIPKDIDLHIEIWKISAKSSAMNKKGDIWINFIMKGTLVNLLVKKYLK